MSTTIPGTHSASYLATIAATFPARDSHGYVVGYYIYCGRQRLAGPFPTRTEAEADKAFAPLLKAGWARLVVGHVFSAKGRTVGTAEGDSGEGASR